MKTTGVFLPFWNLIGLLIAWELLQEGLKKLGLLGNSNTKK